jgi:hypothetical protein
VNHGNDHEGSRPDGAIKAIRQPTDKQKRGLLAAIHRRIEEHYPDLKAGSYKVSMTYSEAGEVEFDLVRVPA